MSRPPGSAVVLRGDAAHLPLPDESADLIITSPPFWQLRSYTDGGRHYDGQIGSEATPQEYIAALLRCTREWVRVLKPSGSLFIELGDVYGRGRNPAADYAGVRRGTSKPGEASEWTNATAAWLAAVLDCEGSVSGRIFTNTSGGESFVVWMRVCMMDREVVDRIYEIAGVGRVFRDSRGAWTWHVASQAARYVLERIWPWLVIKKRRALTAIELCRHVEDRAATGLRTLTPADLAYRRMLVTAIRDWNGHPARRNDYQPPVPAKIYLPDNLTTTADKCLLDLPARYSIACVDQLGLIKRANIVWHYVNGLPESVTDRVRAAHSMVFHFTKQARYYSAVDEIREEHAPVSVGRARRAYNAGDLFSVSTPNTLNPEQFCNPLGKLPGSVWAIPSAPLVVPERVAHARCCGGRARPGCEDGLDHYAAFPPALVKPIVLGWSPPGVCVACGEGRRPVTSMQKVNGTPRRTGVGSGRGSDDDNVRGFNAPGDTRASVLATITGYACACPVPDAPTAPAVVVDPCGGTGTTSLVAAVLGRIGVTVDRSMSYCELATWRTRDPGERARALGVPKPPPVPEGQISLFDGEPA